MATWTNKFGLTLEYDPNANYIFTDANGNQVMHGGDNGYVAQSVTENMPIYVSSTDGRWYTEPYVEVIDDRIVTHVPEWFKETPEYNDWNNQLATFDLDRMTDQQKNEAQEVMADIGRVGAGRRALRSTLANTYHLTDPAAQDAVINNLAGISQGGEGTIAAFSNGQMGKQENINDVLETIANVRREHGSESISRTMTGYQDTLQKAMEGRQVDTQELVEAITQSNLMTAVRENPGKFNDPNYANIWETSVSQNINAFFHSVNSAMIQAIPFTEALLQAGYSIAGGEGRAIDAYNEQLNQPLYGGGLEGQETAVALGSFTGNVASFAVMVSAGTVAGGMVSSKLASTITPASTLGRVGTALGSTAVGTAAVDFATNDLPTDLVYGVSDFSSRLGANGGDVGEAFGYAWSRPSSDPANPNRLFFFFGPDVGEGFLGNLAQDTVIDGVLFAVPILQAAGGSIGRRIDDLAGGAFSRFGEQVALMNLSLQDRVSQWPVIRNVVDFVNTKVINPQDAELMHQARQAAIASRSMTPYVNAQNAITLRNHRGMPAISAELRALDKQYGISESVNNFARNSRSYGGMGKTIFDDPSVPESKRVIIDQVPEQVKRGVNNYMALADGERRLSHISADDDREEVARFREQIAALRAEVDALPDEIKEFARRLSDYSQAIARIGARHGITDEVWLRNIQADPERQTYIPRYVIQPNAEYDAPYDPTETPAAQSATLRGTLGTFDPDRNYVDPITAINFKIDAIARAVAENTVNQAIRDTQVAIGNVDDTSNIEAAQSLHQVNQAIRDINYVRDVLDYDSSISSFRADMENVGNTLSSTSFTIVEPETITIQGTFSSRETPELKAFQTFVSSGRITIPDDVKSAAGLNDFTASQVINNAGGDFYFDPNDVNSPFDGIGVTDDGEFYEFTGRNGAIDSFKKLTEPKDMANALYQTGSYYTTNTATAAELGEAGMAAAARASRFYSDNLPVTNLRATVRTFTASGRAHKNTLGYVYAVPRGIEVVGGRLRVNTPVIHLNDGKGKGTHRYNISTGRGSPRNADPETATMIHENAHLMVQRVAVEKINARVDEGNLDLDALSPVQLRTLVREEVSSAATSLVKDAQKALGGSQSARALNLLRQEISLGASYGKTRLARDHETIAEALVDYANNGTNAAPLSRAIYEQICANLHYNPTPAPQEVMARNGIAGPSSMFTEAGEFNFPEEVTTMSQKAEWLNARRQENPYLDKELNGDNYVKANMWDSFFRQEVKNYGGVEGAAAPELLNSRNQKYLELERATVGDAIKSAVNELGMPDAVDDVTTMIYSRRPEDVASAIEHLITRRVDSLAQELANKMATPDLTKARAAVWSDEDVEEAVTEMVRKFTPELGETDPDAVVHALFMENAKGFATIDRLPGTLKEQLRQRDRLLDEIQYNNEELADYDVGNAGTVLSFTEGGQEVYYYTSDPVVKNALREPDYMKNLTSPDGLVAAATIINRLYRTTTTSINPMNMINNVVRDPITAFVTAGTNPINAQLNPMTHYRNLVSLGVNENVAREVLDRVIEEARAGSFVSVTRNIDYESTSRARRAQDWLNNNKAIHILETPQEAWDTFWRTQVGMQSFERHYQRTGDADAALSRALFDASTATTNFSNSLGAFRHAVGTVPYLSSAINGTRSFAQMFNVDPIGVMTRLTSGLIAPIMAITLWNLSTEENRQTYMSVPEWFRQTHLVLVLPDSSMLMVPLPQETEAFTSLTRHLIEYTYDASPMSIGAMLAKGALGLLPIELDSFIDNNGEVDLSSGTAQLLNNLSPQAVTAIYEWFWQEDLYTGQDISDYDLKNRLLNLATNILGTGVRQIVNDVGSIIGSGEDFWFGKGLSETMAQNLFGIGFDDATTQFYEMIGSPSSVDETGRATKATGLFAEQEILQGQLEDIQKEMAYSSDSQVAELESKRQGLINEFTDKVATMVNKYMQLYTNGGLPDWMRRKVITLLNIGTTINSFESGSYQAEAANQAGLNDYSAGLQRYVATGLPSGPTIESFARDESGDMEGSIELRAALNRYYGSPRQATADFNTAVERAGLSDIRSEFREQINAIYDAADENNTAPDYDAIEKLQLQYLQAVDAVLVPILNEYGIAVLNNNDFLDEVRRYVNGMVPSDDWRQSVENNRYYLSSRQFPMAEADVQEWLIDRYSSSMRERSIESDQEVVDRLSDIRSDIDAGRMGAAESKIRSLLEGMQVADFYISPEDLNTLYEYQSMLN